MAITVVLLASPLVAGFEADWSTVWRTDHLIQPVAVPAGGSLSSVVAPYHPGINLIEAGEVIYRKSRQAN